MQKKIAAIVGTGAAAVITAGVVSAVVLPGGHDAASAQVGTQAAPAAQASPRAAWTPTPSTSVLGSSTEAPAAPTTAPTAPTATPSAAPVATPMPTSLTYVVKGGDNLYDIAAWFHLHGYGDLYEMNKAAIGADPNLIHPGLRITITRTGALSESK